MGKKKYYKKKGQIIIIVVSSRFIAQEKNSKELDTKQKEEHQMKLSVFFFV